MCFMFDNACFPLAFSILWVLKFNKDKSLVSLEAYDSFLSIYLIRSSNSAIAKEMHLYSCA